MHVVESPVPLGGGFVHQDAIGTNRGLGGLVPWQRLLQPSSTHTIQRSRHQTSYAAAHSLCRSKATVMLLTIVPTPAPTPAPAPAPAPKPLQQ